MFISKGFCGEKCLELFKKTKKGRSELFSHEKNLTWTSVEWAWQPQARAWETRLPLRLHHLSFSAESTWVSFPFTTLYPPQPVQWMLIKYPLKAFILHWMTWVVTGLKKLSELHQNPRLGGERKEACVCPRGCLNAPRTSRAAGRPAGTPSPFPTPPSPQLEASGGSPNRSTGSLETEGEP